MQSRLSYNLIIFLLAFVCVTQYLQFAQWNFDDGYIVFRIVKNLLAGNGWAYNIGEQHNASTSALNTIVLYLSSLVTKDIILSAHILGTLWIFIAGLASFFIFHKRHLLVSSALAAYLTIQHLSWNYTWGIETNFFIAVFLLFILLEANQKNSWPLIAILILIRPDAFILAAIKFLFDFYKERTIPFRSRVVFVIILLPWFVFSIAKFGQIFPDTLKEKMWQGQSGFWGNGLIYAKALVLNFYPKSTLQFIISILALPGVFLAIKNKSKLNYFYAFSILQQIAYIILNVPGYHWYFTTINFSLLLSALESLCAILEILPKRSLKIFNPLIALAIIIHSAFDLNNALKLPAKDVRDASYIDAAEVINSSDLKPGSLAVVEVGTLGFYINRKIIDMVGLTSTNPEFISGEYNETFFNDKLPQLVVLHDPIWPHERAIYEDIRFQLYYKRIARNANQAVTL
ncbi:MAG: hypothetical protein KDD56_07285, partial [Bdellovibrionales bacterium]|nr:hypothetical protein [Bdellovibrionales bacterium]